MVSSWSAVGPKKVELSYTHTGGKKTPEKWTIVSWSLSAGDSGPFSTKGQGEQRGPSLGLEACQSREWQGWAWSAGSHGKWWAVSGWLQAFLCSVNWPNVSRTFLADEELEVWPCAEMLETAPRLYSILPSVFFLCCSFFVFGSHAVLLVLF